MKVDKYLASFIKDFFTIYGCIMFIGLLFLGINSTHIIISSLFWQVLLIASAFTFFKYAFVNKYELKKKAQLINFTICSTMADLLVVLWLCLFSPGKLNDNNLLIVYIVIILVVKGAVYAMSYIDGQKQAKQLNEKLDQYKNNFLE